jgi:hypothetical protein
VKKHCSIRIDNEFLTKIDQIAREEGRSRGDVIRRIIRNNFEEEKPKAGDPSLVVNERGGLGPVPTNRTGVAGKRGTV